MTQMLIQSDLSILTKMASCSVTPLSKERHRLQKAAACMDDTVSPSTLSEKLQAAFFAGKVFAMIEDKNKTEANFTASLDQSAVDQSVNEKSAVKRTLQDLYCHSDLTEEQHTEQQRIRSCLTDTLFTFEGHQMLYHPAEAETSSSSQLPDSRKMRARTPQGKHVSCAHLH